MTVKRLIELLQEFDEDKEIIIRDINEGTDNYIRSIDESDDETQVVIYPYN